MNSYGSYVGTAVFVFPFAAFGWQRLGRILFILLILVIAVISSLGLLNSNSRQMLRARANHATLLLENGDVLVGGGASSLFTSTSTCELYNPLTNLWTSTGSLHSSVNEPSLLKSKDRIIVIENNDDGHLGDMTEGAAMESYSADNGEWIDLGLSTHSSQATSVVLNNGTLLFIGGMDKMRNSTSACELLDLANNTWTDTGRLLNDRLKSSAIVLSNGEVLVVGGKHYVWHGISGRIYSETLLSSSELYDPVNRRWTQVGDKHQPDDDTHTKISLLLLQNGKVLAIDQDECEIYDPVTKIWSLTSNMRHDGEHKAVLLHDGRVFAVGVNCDSELYDPTKGYWTDENPLPSRHGSFGSAEFGMTVLSNGMVLVTGGGYFGDDGDAIRDCEVFNPATGKWISPTK